MVALAGVFVITINVINMMNLPNLFDLQWSESIITLTANAASALIYIIFFSLYGNSFNCISE
jgi:hypothetical protein